MLNLGHLTLDPVEEAASGLRFSVWSACLRLTLDQITSLFSNVLPNTGKRIPDLAESQAGKAVSYLGDRFLIPLGDLKKREPEGIWHLKSWTWWYNSNIHARLLIHFSKGIINRPT